MTNIFMPAIAIILLKHIHIVLLIDRRYNFL